LTVIQHTIFGIADCFIIRPASRDIFVILDLVRIEFADPLEITISGIEFIGFSDIEFSSDIRSDVAMNFPSGALTLIKDVTLDSTVRIIGKYLFF
jgi:hypothetical protein